MKPLSHCLTETLIVQLRDAVAADCFPDICFEDAIRFLSTDGRIPTQTLEPSFLELEKWVRQHAVKQQEVVFTSTDLKNRTGQVIDAALRGRQVIVTKHGRPLVKIERLPHEPTMEVAR